MSGHGYSDVVTGTYWFQEPRTLWQRYTYKARRVKRKRFDLKEFAWNLLTVMRTTAW